MKSEWNANTTQNRRNCPTSTIQMKPTSETLTDKYGRECQMTVTGKDIVRPWYTLCGLYGHVVSTHRRQPDHMSKGGTIRHYIEMKERGQTITKKRRFDVHTRIHNHMSGVDLRDGQIMIGYVHSQHTLTWLGLFRFTLEFVTAFTVSVTYMTWHRFLTTSVVLLLFVSSIVLLFSSFCSKLLLLESGSNKWRKKRFPSHDLAATKPLLLITSLPLSHSRSSIPIFHLTFNWDKPFLPSILCIALSRTAYVARMASMEVCIVHVVLYRRFALLHWFSTFSTFLPPTLVLREDSPARGCIWRSKGVFFYCNPYSFTHTPLENQAVVLKCLSSSVCNSFSIGV